MKFDKTPVDEKIAGMKTKSDKDGNWSNLNDSLATGRIRRNINAS